MVQSEVKVMINKHKSVCVSNHIGLLFSIFGSIKHVIRPVRILGDMPPSSPRNRCPCTMVVPVLFNEG